MELITANSLKAIASEVNDTAERVAAIPGLCKVAAEGGAFLCRFDRAEYVVSDFDCMVTAGCVVEWDCSTIYVRWA